MDEYTVITFLHFDILFRTNQKFIYTFLEIFEKSEKILVFGFSDNYDFLKSADPRIISRFPKKTYLFEKSNYFGFKEWFHKNTHHKSCKKLREIVKEDKTFSAMLETAQMLGTSFKDFEKTVKRYFTDLLWFVTVSLNDKTENNSKYALIEGQERENCVNYIPAPVNDEYVIDNLTKLVDKKRKIYFAAQNSEDSLIEEKDVREVEKAMSDSYVVNVASKVHKIYKRLKECHLVVLIGFFEAKKKYGSKISFENIYLKYCGNLAEDKLIKQDPIIISLYLKEMVAMDLLNQFEERGKTYYDIQGSIHYLGNVFHNIANDSRINFSIKEKLKRIIF